jgi:hypothetical protein
MMKKLYLKARPNIPTLFASRAAFRHEAFPRPAKIS